MGWEPKIAFRTRGKPYSDEQRAFIKRRIMELYRDNSTAKIASILTEEMRGLTFTRNMVIGFKARHIPELKGIPIRLDQFTAKRASAVRIEQARSEEKEAARQAEIARKKLAKAHEAKLNSPEAMVTPEAVAPVADVPGPVYQPKKLADLEYEECRWIVEGTGADSWYCAAPMDPDRTHAPNYCKKHGLVSVSRPEIKERRAANYAHPSFHLTLTRFDRVVHLSKE